MRRRHSDAPTYFELQHISVGLVGIFWRGNRGPTKEGLYGGPRVGSVGKTPQDAGEVLKNIQIKAIKLTILGKHFRFYIIFNKKFEFFKKF